MKKSHIFTFSALFSLSLILGGCKDTNSSISASAEPIGGSMEPVPFWIATDIHYLDKGLQDSGKAFQTYVTNGDGKQLPYSDELAEALVYDIQQQKPKFLILSGDLTNNGEASSHAQLTAKLKRIEELGTSVYVIPGNHDLFNPWARSFKGDKQVLADSITDKDFTALYGEYGYNEALSRDKETLSYAVRAAPGLWLLMIDSSQYIHNQKYGFPQTDGRVAESTLSWMDSTVKLAAAEHASILTVMHHNLLSHTSMSVSGFKLNNSQETMKVLRRNNLNLVLSGHIHMQDIRVDPTPGKNGTLSSEETPVYDIATSAMAVNPHQYGAMTFDPVTRAVKYHTAELNVAGWAKDSGQSDPNLLNFKAYAEDSFTASSFDKAMQGLQDRSYTEAEKQSMAEVMAQLNVRYFAGTAGSSAADIKDMPGYKLWEDATEGFMGGYIQSMTAPKEPGNVSLEVILNKQ